MLSSMSAVDHNPHVLSSSLLNTSTYTLGKGVGVGIADGLDVGVGVGLDASVGGRVTVGTTVGSSSGLRVSVCVGVVGRIVTEGPVKGRVSVGVIVFVDEGVDGTGDLVSMGGGVEEGLEATLPAVDVGLGKRFSAIRDRGINNIQLRAVMTSTAPLAAVMRSWLSSGCSLPKAAALTRAIPTFASR